MADALTKEELLTKEDSIHQALHGYSDGHRLIESSITIPNELDRLMLRLSDLSGRNVVPGFEEYLTGYPLIPMKMFALAKTWYASEMPRPGCVWTHTLLIPNSRFTTPSLDIFLSLFRRPQKGGLPGTYRDPISVSALEANRAKQTVADCHPATARFLNLYYGEPTKPILIPAQSPVEYEQLIFAFWSQQWQFLRLTLTFSTGSLAARHIDGRALDVQCVPVPLLRDVELESQEQGMSPLTLTERPEPMAEWSLQAANDLEVHKGGKLRSFLWDVSEPTNHRADFKPFVLVHKALRDGVKPESLIALVAGLFPSPSRSGRLKRLLFGDPADRSEWNAADETSLLMVLGASEHHAAFDGESLQLKKRGEKISCDHRSAQKILEQLFCSPVTPFGSEILVGLISAMNIEAVREVTSTQPRFLATIVEANPGLATSARVWELAGNRKHELLDSVTRSRNLDPKVVRGVVWALLDSRLDDFTRRAFEVWGREAVFSALDWVQKNGVAIPNDCRGALTFHVSTVVEWVESGPAKTPQVLRAAASVLAPYSYEICDRDTQVWYRAFESASEDESLYLFAFILALALGNAPPSPRKLIKDSFEIVYRAAWDEKISDKAWEILDPIVPHLMWPNDWDRCERMRRGLISAFVRHGWPATELPHLIPDAAIRDQLLGSAQRVRGGEAFLQTLVKLNDQRTTR